MTNVRTRWPKFQWFLAACSFLSLQVWEGSRWHLRFHSLLLTRLYAFKNRTWRTWWGKQGKLPLWTLTDPPKTKGELLFFELSLFVFLMWTVCPLISLFMQGGWVCIPQWHEECHIQAWWDRTEWSQTEDVWGQQKVRFFLFILGCIHKLFRNLRGFKSVWQTVKRFNILFWKAETLL